MSIPEVPEPLLMSEENVKLDGSQRSRIWQRIFWHMLQATLLEEFLVRVDPDGSPELIAAARADAERVFRKLHETRAKEPLVKYEDLPPPDYSCSNFIISQSPAVGSDPVPLETMGLSLPNVDLDLSSPQRPTSSSNETRRSRISINGLTREMGRRLRTISLNPSEPSVNFSQHPMQPSSRPFSINPNANLVQALRYSNSVQAVSQSPFPDPVDPNCRNSRLVGRSESSSSIGSNRVSQNLSIKSCSCSSSRYQKFEKVKNSAFNAGEGITDAESWTRILLDRDEVGRSSVTSNHVSQTSSGSSNSSRSQLLSQTQRSEPEGGEIAEDEERARLRHRELALRTLCSEDTAPQARRFSSPNASSNRNSTLPTNSTSPANSTLPAITLVPFPVSVNVANCQSMTSSSAPPQNNDRSSSSSQTVTNSQQGNFRRGSRRSSRRFSSGFFGLPFGIGTTEEVRQRTE